MDCGLGHYSGVGIFGLFFWVLHFSKAYFLSSLRVEEFLLSPFLVETCSPLFALFSNLDSIELPNKYHALGVSRALLVNVGHAIVFVHEAG